MEYYREQREQEAGPRPQPERPPGQRPDYSEAPPPPIRPERDLVPPWEREASQEPREAIVTQEWDDIKEQLQQEGNYWDEQYIRAYLGDHPGQIGDIDKTTEKGSESRVVRATRRGVFEHLKEDQYAPYRREIERVYLLMGALRHRELGLKEADLLKGAPREKGPELDLLFLILNALNARAARINEELQGGLPEAERRLKEKTWASLWEIRKRIMETIWNKKAKEKAREKLGWLPILLWGQGKIDSWLKAELYLAGSLPEHATGRIEGCFSRLKKWVILADRKKQRSRFKFKA